MTPASPQVPKPLPFWVAPLPLIIAAAILGASWSSIPDRWIVHWGPGGVPNGWAHRSVGAVFGPLLLSLPLFVVFEVIILVIRSRRAARPALAPVTEGVVHLIRLILCAMLAMQAAIVAAMPFGRMKYWHPLIAFPILLITAIALGQRRISEAVRGVRAAGHGTEMEGYNGFFYRNPKDPRLWVPKLIGVGKTINFAHPMAWPTLILVLLGPLVFLVLLLLVSSQK